MKDNERFISRWKPIHENSMVKYLVITPLVHLLIVSLTTTLVLWISPWSQTKKDYLIMGVALIFLIYAVERILEWVRGEKRYREIMNKINSRNYPE